MLSNLPPLCCHKKSVFLVFMMLGLAGVYSNAWCAPPVKSLKELRQDRVVVQQWDLSCGAAALATLLAFQHGDPVPEKSIASSLIRRKEYLDNPSLLRAQQGFSMLDLKRYVDSRGYQGNAFGRLTLKDIKQKAPIMVPVNANGYNHFVIFIGERKGRVLLADPAWGKRTMTVERFERIWIKFPNLGRVGFEVEKEGSSNTVNQLVPEMSDFVMFR